MANNNDSQAGNGRYKLDFVTIFTIIITNLVTLSGSFLAFKSSKDQSQTVFIEATLNQVQRQSKEIVELRGLLLTAQIKIIELESRVRTNVDEKQLLDEFLDALPFPAWVKRYDPINDKFIMTLLNQQYTSDFGFTQNQYIGKTDADIHGPELAESYIAADLYVLRTGIPDVREQTIISKSGKRHKIYVYKFAIYMADGEKAIGGVAINIADVQEKSKLHVSY